MGTHPIFESDFDCLTGMGNFIKLCYVLCSLIGINGQAKMGGLFSCRNKQQVATMEKYSKCRMNVAQTQGRADMDMLIKMFNAEIKRTRQIEKLRGKLCRRAARIYVPNGLMDQIPEEWGCEWEELITVPSGDKNKPLFGEDGSLTELLKLVKRNDDPNTKPHDPNAINIIIIGVTGAGKSYFTNALLGCQTPNDCCPGTSRCNEGAEETCPYATTSPAANSCTQTVDGFPGTIYNSHYRKHGIDVKIRIFDTPGFGDADPDNIYKNKLLIANLLKEEVHAVIHLIQNRFDEANQQILNTMNEWSSGQLWDNLMVVMGRANLDEKAFDDLCKNGNTVDKKIRDTKTVRVNLLKRARLEGWKVSKLDYEKKQEVDSRPFVAKDAAK